jgi:hypothetical protein
MGPGGLIAAAVGSYALKRQLEKRKHPSVEPVRPAMSD